MKAVDFGKLAAAAEVQRMQRMGSALRAARRVSGYCRVVRVVCSGGGARGALGALLWTLEHRKGVGICIVLATDLILAMLFVVLGRSKQPGIAESQARVTRDQNLGAMKSALAFTAVSGTVMGPAGRMAGRSIVELVRGRMRRRRERRRVR